ncbi:SURF1 family protein [Bradyrhizobium sp. SYSU BS000235]|uniref:SURF1 family protein n=1 Tax=Bradyrhizobium sp. SYSU BS000235 TaxID=3411332 RepID=UPI003C720B9E
MITFETREAMAGGRTSSQPASRLEDESRSLPRPSVRKRIALGVAATTVFAILCALGVWQLERRVWKLDLIERVDRRVHAAAVPAPGPSAWAHVNAADDAYRHVQVKGRFLDSRATLVKAVTERGPGYWVMAPFRTGDGFSVLVNRGFVPSDQDVHEALKAGHGETAITGLLRVSEPGGGFLRTNDPAADRWYSRDVDAIARARGIKDVAPYFIDADAAADSHVLPVGGLTVISFPNNHLVYAITWFGLAIMLLGWMTYAMRQEWILRKRHSGRAIT